MEVGVVVVPRCGDIYLLFVDCAHATLTLELKRGAQVDIFVVIGADVALGVGAFVVADKLRAADYSLCRGHIE